jgi:hypothetical protein
MSVETYLRVCEQLGQEPDPAKMPLDASDFPGEVQVAFFMFDILPDRWEGMSGTYMGKDISNIKELFDLYEIDYPKEILFLIRLYDNILIKHRVEEQERNRKKQERKSQGEGKNKISRGR